MTSTLNDFLSSAPAPMNANTPVGARIANELRRMVTEQAEAAPRSQQAHLGPSELGAACDRQVVGKLVGEPVTNHVVDAWPSWVGTGLHAHVAIGLAEWNVRHGEPRYVTEQRVIPIEGHAGTADLYDAHEQAVIDHKFLGQTSMAKLRNHGPTRQYLAQILLYARGYRNLGLPVRRVALAAWPRTGSSLDGLYVWERECSPADDQLLAEVAADTARRKAIAGLVNRGLLTLEQVPRVPDDQACYFCPFYRPESSRSAGYGCPGTVGHPR